MTTAQDAHQPNTRTHDIVSRHRFGALDLVAVNTTHGVYSIRAYCGPTEIPELAFTTPSRTEFRRRWVYIGTRARDGVLAETIAAEIAVLVDAAAIVIASAEVA